jgi:hypothetical protein
MPSAMPASRIGRSALRSPSANAASAPKIGTDEMMSAARPEAMCCSAVVSRIHGIAISSTAKATIGRQCASAGRIPSARFARYSNTTAASEVRPNTTTAGSSSSTATRMKKYGTPQMSAIAQNSTHPRRVTRASCRVEPTWRHRDS